MLWERAQGCRQSFGVLRVPGASLCMLEGTPPSFTICTPPEAGTPTQPGLSRGCPWTAGPVHSEHKEFRTRHLWGSPSLMSDQWGVGVSHSCILALEGTKQSCDLVIRQASPVGLCRHLGLSLTSTLLF